MYFLLLLVAGLAGGVINSIAGGASIFIYPLLLSQGLKPVTANATMSLVVWPGTVTSAFGYRRFIAQIPKKYFLLIIPSFIGGGFGAYALGHTTNGAFEYVIPWLLLFAAILIGLHGQIEKLIDSNAGRKFEGRHPLFLITSSVLMMLALSIYGGYFGGGFGIMMLGFLSLTSIQNINQMNGFKNVISIGMNILAISYFVSHHLVDWHVLPALLIGNTIGGWLGATYGARLPAQIIRTVVATAGVIVSITLLVRLYI